ncbi:MAG: hypothetical protein U0183_17355 [Polyangiaceae bacterium]
MSEQKEKDFPTLTHPPIIEVVCGFVYDATPLNVLHWGVYWDARKVDFPETALHPAIIEGLSFPLTHPPMRAWLQARSGDRLLQLQHDRFFYNWRATGQDRSDYPRFRDRPGKPGLQSDAIAEFRKFEHFCASRFDTELKLQRIELTKIDVLVRDGDWANMSELAEILPATAAFKSIQRSDEREVSLRFVEHVNGHAVVVDVNTMRSPPTSAIATEARLECRAIVPATPGVEVESMFAEANLVLNTVFFDLMSPTQVHRFSGEKHR